MIRLSRSATARFGALSLQRKFALVAGALMFATSLCFLILVLGLHLNSVSASNERAVRSVNRLLQAALENAMLKRDIPGLREIITDAFSPIGMTGSRMCCPCQTVAIAGKCGFAMSSALSGSTTHLLV